jgi:modulator of FtsH protease
MAGFDVAQWHDLFVAEAGAAAALAGLLFVAISINLKRILDFPVLPARAAATLITLIMTLVVATLVLVPAQSTQLLGVELVAVSVPTWCGMLAARLRHGRTEHQSKGEYALELGLMNLAMAPYAAAGLSLIAGGGGGLYWTVAGLVFAFISAADNAWVLLVEIMR